MARSFFVKCIEGIRITITDNYLNELVKQEVLQVTVLGLKRKNVYFTFQRNLEQPNVFVIINIFAFLIKRTTPSPVTDVLLNNDMVEHTTFVVSL